MGRYLNARAIAECARDEDFAVPALNANGANYDITRAIIEAAEETDSPLIIQAYEKNISYRGCEYFQSLVDFLARGTHIPIAIALDHGSSLESILRAVRAGFTAVMVDCAGMSLEENIAWVRQIVELVRPLGVSVEAEVSEIVATEEPGEAPVTDPKDVRQFTEECDADLLAVAVGTAHGIFKVQDHIDFEALEAIDRVTDVPLVLHGTCGLQLDLIRKAARRGMDKINFGEMFRLNYIDYYVELSRSLSHEGHTWRISEACKDRLKGDIMGIIEALGCAGKAGLVAR